MAELIPNGLVWEVYPDQPITRRKWRHVARSPDGEAGLIHGRFGPLLEAILEHDPAQIVVKLPNGMDCAITRLPQQQKEP